MLGTWHAQIIKNETTSLISIQSVFALKKQPCPTKVAQRVGGILLVFGMKIATWKDV